jgi:hemerythrin-like domain-containing protein
MKATDVLMDEHRVIERVLTALETGANRLEKGQPITPEFFLSATEFMRGYADGCHHQKEEGVLFKRLQDQGIPAQGCPLGVMLAEHEAGRQYTRALRTAAQDMRSGIPGAQRRAIQSSRSYVALLRQHIVKEDENLFPMAEQVIPAQLHDTIMESFEQVEYNETVEGNREKYLALAETLEREIAV